MGSGDGKSLGRPAKLKEIADETADFFDGIQKAHSERAQEAGYIRDLFRSAGTRFESHPDDPILDVTENSFRRFRDFAKSQAPSFLSYPKMDGTAYSIVASASAASAVAFSMVEMPSTDTPKWRFVFPSPDVPPPCEPPDAKAVTATHLEKLSAELAQVYRSVWEGLRGTSSNPERIALFQMRQVFDHFFEHLATDEEVRESTFFTPKEGKDPNKVHRGERIRFAAHRHILNKEKAAFLASQAEDMVVLYRRLNGAHKRGPLNAEIARRTVLAMDVLIREWLNAMSVPGGPFEFV